MHPPLLVSRCNRSILQPLARSAPSRHFTKVTREYIPNRITRRSARLGHLVRRVFVEPESIIVEQEGAKELDVIPPTPQHRRGPRISRFEYAPAERLTEEVYIPSLINKVAIGPKARRIWNNFDLEPANHELESGPLIRRIGATPFRFERSMTAPGHQLKLEEDKVEGEAVPVRKVPRNALPLEGHIIDMPELKTTYVDTHCHLFSTLRMLKDSLQDETIPQDAVNTFVKTIFPKQVIACVDIHCDLPLSDYHERAVALDWPEHFKYYFAIGAHPHVAMGYTDEDHERIIATMSNPSCVAWGECGLDYLKNPDSTHETQRTVFKRQLAAAVSLNKPIIVHTRDADADTLACIRETVPRDHHMHIHCFTSGRNLARTILEEYPNSFIGLTGVVSYSGTEHVAELVTTGELPLDRILLETDSPYMVPKPAYSWLAREKPELRKGRFMVSHSGMIPFTAEILRGWVNERRAQTGGPKMGLEEVLDVTRRNAARMYGIDV